jgi:hypothetical protein
VLLLHHGQVDPGRRRSRITYWIAGGRRVVLLTVFRKTRMRETREIERSLKAFQKCVREEHTLSAVEEV